MRPWHFWPAALASLVWTLAAAADYLLTELRVPAYLGLFPSDVVAYVVGFPVWLVAVWGIGVWAGLAGVLMVAGLLTWFAAPVALFIGVVGAWSVFKAVYIDKRKLKCACVGGHLQ